MARASLETEYVFSESDRQALFFGALSKPLETGVSAYAFEAVSKAFSGSTVWSQWMGTALHDLDDFTEYKIDKLIDLNLGLDQRGSDAPYQASNQGGWSVKHAPFFMGQSIDLHLGYVVDGDGVGYSVIFPKNPESWLLSDRTSSSFLKYRLWGNSDYVDSISLEVCFDEPQARSAHSARFLVAATKLLSAAIPADPGRRILQGLEAASPFFVTIGSLQAKYTFQTLGGRGELQSSYAMNLRHVDRRFSVIKWIDTMAGRRTPPPTRLGGWSYQSACLQNSLFRLGLGLVT